MHPWCRIDHMIQTFYRWVLYHLSYGPLPHWNIVMPTNMTQCSTRSHYLDTLTRSQPVLAISQYSRGPDMVVTHINLEKSLVWFWSEDQPHNLRTEPKTYCT